MDELDRRAASTRRSKSTPICGPRDAMDRWFAR
jgi:hypothetical protein